MEALPDYVFLTTATANTKYGTFGKLVGDDVITSLNIAFLERLEQSVLNFFFLPSETNFCFLFLQQNSPLFSQLLKPHLGDNKAGQGGQNGQAETAQRLAALLAAAAQAAASKDPDMKVPPISLPSGLPFSPDLLWRYPNPFLPQPPPSPLETQLKSQLPGGLGHDPRQWAREDVMVFLRYCEREFDLDKIDLEKFNMNGN